MNEGPLQDDNVTRVQLQDLLRLQSAGESLALRAGPIRSSQAGSYLSPFKGRGMEFDETRRYEPGDDVRNIDWRVTARTGKVHTKLFREERERPVLLWLDLRQSMFFATHGVFKSVQAAHLASLLTWSAVGQRDRLGGLIFSDDHHVEMRPMNGRTAALRWLQSICLHPAWDAQGRPVLPSAGDSLRQAMARLHNVAHPGSLIFLISDFRGFDEAAERQLGLIARHNDVLMLQISDPLERELPPAGYYRLRDKQGELNLDSSTRSIRQRHHQRFVEHQQRLQSACRRFGVFFQSCSTEQDPRQLLQSGLGLHRR